MADVVLKNRVGANIEYNNVNQVAIDDGEGNLVYFTHGNVVQTTIAPDFSNGDDVETSGDDFWDSVTVQKPQTLLPENIVNGVSIAGVTGNFQGIDTSDATLSSGNQMLSGVTAYANATKITGTIPTLTSSDLTVSDDTVTAPSGYYASPASKAVSAGVAKTPSVSLAKDPTISLNSSTGLITASVSGSATITPSVTPGYISTGTSGKIFFSGNATEQLSVQAGATITPTESQQTAVDAGKYTTGAVVVDPIPSQYVVPTGTVSISTNGTFNVKNYETADVNIGSISVSALNVTSNGTYTAPASSAYSPVVVNVPGLVPTGTKQISITSNGTTTEDVSSYQYAEVTASVPNSYSVSDEGKVVDSGALVSQTSKNISANGTYTTTTNNQVNVSVPNTYSAGDEGKVVSGGALVSQSSAIYTTNGIYDTTNISSTVVNVQGGGGGAKPSYLIGTGDTVSEFYFNTEYNLNTVLSSITYDQVDEQTGLHFAYIGLSYLMAADLSSVGLGNGYVLFWGADGLFVWYSTIAFDASAYIPGFAVSTPGWQLSSFPLGTPLTADLSDMNAIFSVVLDNTIAQDEIAFGSAGSKPQLAAPTIDIYGHELRITNPAGNGNHVSAYDIYVDGVKTFTTANTTYNLYTLQVASATITVKATGTEFDESDASNAVVFYWYYTLVGTGLSFATNSGTATWDGTLSYSTDGTSWTVWDGTTITSDLIMFRGVGNSTISGSYNADYTYTGTDISAYGNIETMLDYAAVLAGNHPTMGNYCCYKLFQNCTGLIKAPALPAVTLAVQCYAYMFANCTNLTTPPELPATAVSGYSYSSMFRNCGITKAPELPATTLASYCYQFMFFGCSALTKAPNLPATTLSNGCYWSMFASSAIKEAPELPATTLIASCYAYMFNNCGSLISVPELPATTLASYCYQFMFNSCISLKLPPELPATQAVSGCYTSMFSGCSSLERLPRIYLSSLPASCCNSMFSGCTKIKMSTSRNTTSYPFDYRIPAKGSSSSTTSGWNTSIFSGTGGSYTSNPSAGTTYYTNNSPV